MTRQTSPADLRPPSPGADVTSPQMAARGQKVALDCTGAGKAKAKLSSDLGASFGEVTRLGQTGLHQGADQGLLRHVVGDRVVFEFGVNKKGVIAHAPPVDRWRQELGRAHVGHIGARIGTLLKKSQRHARGGVVQRRRQNGTDTFPAKYETAVTGWPGARPTVPRSATLVGVPPIASVGHVGHWPQGDGRSSPATGDRRGPGLVAAPRPPATRLATGHRLELCTWPRGGR